MNKILAEIHHKKLISPAINSSEHANIYDHKDNFFNPNDTNLITAKEILVIQEKTTKTKKQTHQKQQQTVNLFKKETIPVLLSTTPSSVSSSSNFSSTSSSPASSSSFTSFIHSNQIEKITLNETNFMYNNLKRLSAARSGGATANCLHKTSMRARQVI